MTRDTFKAKGEAPIPVKSNREWREEAERALARAEAAEKDAARYRWLRDLPEGSPHEQIGNFPGDTWDAAIDAARGEKGCK